MGDSSIAKENKDSNQVVASIRGKMEGMSSVFGFNLQRRCIYKVPKRLRRGNEDAYVPEIVSIGPFHHGEENLQGMEEQKKWYLQLLLSQTPTSLDDLVEAIRKLEIDARECYAENTSKLESDQFVEMMLLDGCFILKLFYNYAYEMVRDKNDPIFNAVWMIGSLQHDLMLLENQLPFFIIDALFNLTAGNELGAGKSLEELVILFFKHTIGGIVPQNQKYISEGVYLKKVPGVPRKSDIRGKHLLDILRKKLIPSTSKWGVENHPHWKYTHCATDLEQDGVKIKKKSETNALLDITFKNGVLEIPFFYFNEIINDLFRNLIAMEQCDKDNNGWITSYVMLLDTIINSQMDVRLLRRRKIIEHSFGDDEEVARVINELCNGVFLKKFYYEDMFCRMNKYCGNNWNKWRAILKRDYFRNPWVILSFSVAIVLLLLTFTQTIFSVL